MKSSPLAGTELNRVQARPNADRQRVDEPIYFASGERTLFGWLHRPAAQPGEVASTVGLLICKPFGYETLCAHRSLRAFADAAADLGMPALRFDYSGCGDSSDIDPAADQIDLWLSDVLEAVEELRRRTGVERVCLLGVRLGALLATLAAAQCPAATGLVLIAPVVSGKRYLRELNTTRLAAMMDVESNEAQRGAAESQTAGLLEFSGYPMSAATAAALAQIDLMTRSPPSVSHALLLDRSDLPAARVWNDQLTNAGINTQYLACAGFVEMAMVAPERAVVPEQMISAMQEWLQECGHSPPTWEVAGSERGDHAIDISATTMCRLTGADASAAAALTERPVCFGEEAAIFGIVTEPARSELRRRAVILLNAGADFHMGPSRMYVTLARNWARRGYFVLRLDLAGIGDSGTRAGSSANEVFPAEALTDIRAAMDFMYERYRSRDLTLSGLCSGAYHALRAAAAGLPMQRILMVNPQNFLRSRGMSTERLQLAEVVRNPAIYRERVGSLKAWKRLLSGQVDIWRIVKICLTRPVLAAEAALRDAARFFKLRLPRDLGWELEEIVARGVRVVFVFANGEAGIGLLKIQGGSSLKKLGKRCRIHVVDSADHTFSRSAPRLTMEKFLSDELFDGAPLRAPARGGSVTSAPYTSKQGSLRGVESSARAK